ncbi:MAG: PD-(D/E)XK nuclease family protein, partial [Eubacteriales bacterium]|nr:PD-(D/E)XK nuclease family protein [Eubacteriales bacterium]
EERAERARLLYVAMTRAREELILLGCGERLLPEELVNGGERPASAYGVFAAQNMLAWVWQCIGPGDRLLDSDAVSDREPWKMEPPEEFPTESTSFPQKTPPWTVVFHNDEAELAAAMADAQAEADSRNLDLRAERLNILAEEARRAGCLLPEPVAAVTDPVAPPTRFTHHPFKVGATALVHALRQSAPLRLENDGADAARMETEDDKRLPLPLARPKLMDDLPSMPAFLRPPAEQTGLRRGVATHKALSLIDYLPLKVTQGDADGLTRQVSEQLDSLVRRRLMTGEERDLTDARSIVGFLRSPCGRQALAADTLRREWSFNLLLPERDGLIVQGIIDLCYQTDGQWSLVDYKTDRVADADALWALYSEQIALYRRALAEATGIPVRDATLFSLSLGEGSTRISDINGERN